MVVPYRTIGIKKAGDVDILNVKCEPIIMGSFRGKPGFCPAYHMNKDKWITILLDGSAEQEDIKAKMEHGLLSLNIAKKDPKAKLPEKKTIAIE